MPHITKENVHVKASVANPVLDEDYSRPTPPREAPIQ